MPTNSLSAVTSDFVTIQKRRKVANLSRDWNSNPYPQRHYTRYTKPSHNMLLARSANRRRFSVKPLLRPKSTAGI